MLIVAHARGAGYAIRVRAIEPRTIDDAEAARSVRWAISGTVLAPQGPRLIVYGRLLPHPAIGNHRMARASSSVGGWIERAYLVGKPGRLWAASTATADLRASNMPPRREPAMPALITPTSRLLVIGCQSVRVATMDAIEQPIVRGFQMQMRG